MKYLLHIKSTCLLFGLLLFVQAEAQKGEDYFTTFYPLINDEYNPFYEGQIHLENGEVLKGEISLNNYGWGIFSAIMKEENTCIDFPNATIKEVIFFDEDGKVSKYYSINDDGILYREVFKKDEGTLVFDRSTRPFNDRLVPDVWVMDNDQLTNTFSFWTVGPKNDLVKYISKRDGVKYRNRDFKSLDELFQKL